MAVGAERLLVGLVLLLAQGAVEGALLAVGAGGHQEGLVVGDGGAEPRQ